jgi:hypothetical protein
MKVSKIFLAITLLVATSIFTGQSIPASLNRGVVAIGNIFSSNATYIREKMSIFGNQFLSPFFYSSKSDNKKHQSLPTIRSLIKTTATIGIVLTASTIGWHYWIKHKASQPSELVDQHFPLN